MKVSPESMRDAGVEAVLAKPVRQSQLLEAFKMAMSSASEPRSLAPGLMELREAESAEPVAAPAPKLRLLVAEDNPVNQKVALHQLQKLGYSAMAVDNGRLALDAIGANGYDIVFMDCQMPELDGYAATRELRRREGTERHTWIIAMTANSLEGDREKCLATGMDDYISKPVKPEKLEEAIQRFLSRAAEEAAREKGERKEVKPAPEPVAPAPAPAPIPAEPRGPAIDLEILSCFRDMEENGESLLDQLIGVFLDNSPKLLHEAREGLAKRSGEMLAHAAHTLKGSCSNFGAERLRAVCQELENAGHAQNFSQATELLVSVENEFKYVQEALERECAAVPSV
jgi:CheY-like chemotaxis protein/HPt (histidine-containing phosphotransfer) domain-containing protein